MKFKEIHGERTYMLPKLRNMFTQKRKEDDDFAREYASHEFNLWLETYFIKVGDVSGRVAMYPIYEARYKDFRSNLLRTLTTYYAEASLDTTPLQKMGLDELLQELSMYEESLNF